MAKFIEASEWRGKTGWREAGTTLLLLNVEEISSMQKTGEADGDTTIVMRDGRRFVVTESIRTLNARIDSDD